MKTKEQYIPSRELKKIFKIIEDQYGKVPPLFEKLAFIQRKDNIYAITRDIEHLDTTNIRINNLGLYIAEYKNEQFRPSIEGAQLIGPTATKNVHELTKQELKNWLKGDDLPCSTEYTGYIIIKCGNDYIGAGKYKEGHILNFVPKARRILEAH